MSVKFVIVILSGLMVYSSHAHAVSLSEASCLKALSKFEFGEDLKGNGKPVAVLNDDGKVFTWDGNTISMFPRGTYKSALTTKQTSELTWSLEKYEQDRDGRLNKAFPSADVNRAVQLLINQSFSAYFADGASTKTGYRAKVRDEIITGCAEVTTVKYKKKTIEEYLANKTQKGPSSSAPNPEDATR